MVAVLLGPASVVRCERERAYRVLLGQSRAKLSYARMRLARAEVFTDSAVTGVRPGRCPACVSHWLAEVRRWERVCPYLVRRYHLSHSFGV